MNDKAAIDKAYKDISEMMLKKAVAEEKMKPYLDKQLKEVEKIDNKIKWFEGKIKEEEAKKETEIKKMGELLDLAMKSSHALPNGFTVLPDDKREFKVIDAGKFLKWLKANVEPVEVMEFFKTSLKKTSMRSFCDKQANLQTEKGIMEPKIDGVQFGDITYRRLTTEKKKVKKWARRSKKLCFMA